MSDKPDHRLWDQATDVAPLAQGLQLHTSERQDVSPPIFNVLRQGNVQSSGD